MRSNTTFTSPSIWPGKRNQCNAESCPDQTDLNRCCARLTVQ